jgi:hypothetical protein
LEWPAYFLSFQNGVNANGRPSDVVSYFLLLTSWHYQGGSASDRPLDVDPEARELASWRFQTGLTPMAAPWSFGLAFWLPILWPFRTGLTPMAAPQMFVITSYTYFSALASGVNANGRPLDVYLASGCFPLDAVYFIYAYYLALSDGINANGRPRVLHQDPVGHSDAWALCFTGSVLCSGGSDKTVRLWDLERGPAPGPLLATVTMFVLYASQVLYFAAAVQTGPFDCGTLRTGPAS